MENIIFKCKICDYKIYSKFIPATMPSCPTCGGDVELNKDIVEKKLISLCQTCHAENQLYDTDMCERKNCSKESSYWSGKKDIGQDNKKPFENDRVLYKSSRGPEGGTIPRW